MPIAVDGRAGSLDLRHADQDRVRSEQRVHVLGGVVGQADDVVAGRNAEEQVVAVGVGQPGAHQVVRCRLDGAVAVHVQPQLDLGALEARFARLQRADDPAGLLGVVPHRAADGARAEGGRRVAEIGVGHVVADSSGQVMAIGEGAAVGQAQRAQHMVLVGDHHPVLVDAQAVERVLAAGVRRPGRDQHIVPATDGAVGSAADQVQGDARDAGLASVLHAVAVGVEVHQVPDGTGGGRDPAGEAEIQRRQQLAGSQHRGDVGVLPAHVGRRDPQTRRQGVRVHEHHILEPGVEAGLQPRAVGLRRDRVRLQNAAAGVDLGDVDRDSTDADFARITQAVAVGVVPDEIAQRGTYS